jgi:integrating conjugative element protein (TIGR03759 family)
VPSAPDTTLSASELARARAWGLSATEWQRYQQLMQGIRGSVSPATISPIEVLGIHARDGDERRRYAESWARTLHEDVDRILAFQRAYDDAGKHLYPNEPLIDIARLPGKTEKSNTFQANDRVLFFTRAECPACEVVFSALLTRISELAGIDIYLTDVAPGDDEAVRDWASSHTIDPQWVRSRRITLNHDAGALAKLTDRQGGAPTLLRRRGDDLSKLSISDL